MSISDSIPEMPANTSGTYSIMIRANLESDDILITSNNQLAFGQKLQVCCYVNMDSIRLTKKIKLWEGNNVSIRKNTELDPVYQENTEYRIQQCTEYNFRSSWGSATTPPLRTTSRKTSSTTGWSSAQRGDLEPQQNLNAVWTFVRIVHKANLMLKKIVGIGQLG